MNTVSFEEVHTDVYIERHGVVRGLDELGNDMSIGPEALNGNRLELHFHAATGTPQSDIDGFTEAGQFCLQELTDDTLVSFNISFPALGPAILRLTASTETDVSYSACRTQITADATSVDDATAVANLQPGADIGMLINRTVDNPNGSGNAITLIRLMDVGASPTRLKLVGADAPMFDTATFLATPVYGPKADLFNCLIAPAALPSLLEKTPERPGPHNRRRRTAHAGAKLFRGVQAYLVARRNHVPSTAVFSDAWHQFYSRYAPFIRQVVLSFGVQSSDLDDCTQEVWNELMAILPTAKYDPARGPFQSWLRVIVRRKVGEYLNERRRVRLDGSDAGLRDIECCRVPPPDVSAERPEVCETMRSALQAFRQRVSVTNYLILEMHWLDEIPLVEVADRLGLYQEQVWARHRRILQRFRRFLETDRTAAQVFRETLENSRKSAHSATAYFPIGV